MAIAPEAAGGEDLASPRFCPALPGAFEPALDYAVMGALHRRTRDGVALLPEFPVAHPERMGPNIPLQRGYGLLPGHGRRAQAAEGLAENRGIAAQDLGAHVTGPAASSRLPTPQTAWAHAWRCSLRW